MIQYSTARLREAMKVLDAVTCHHLKRRNDMKVHINRIKNTLFAKSYKGRARYREEQQIERLMEAHELHDRLAHKANAYVTKISLELKRRKGSRYRSLHVN